MVKKLKDSIRQHALSLGFARAGFAPLDEAEHADAFRRWLANGHYADMAWMAHDPETRVNPSAYVPLARTAVVTAWPYGAPSTVDSPSVAAYAVGLDYHDVLREKLNDLLAFVRRISSPNTRGWVCVDTSPVLERDLAMRAGIGWIGKNTCLIVPGAGSWFLLGVLFLDLEQESDSPSPSPGHCGTCTRCLDACPTRAFPVPYVLDARKCISYLTIENKGEIPEELRTDLGLNVFGCDVCQAVCPHNTKVSIRVDNSIDPLELLEMDEATFRRRFRGTPFFRTKRRGMIRNACVALGNSGNPEAVPALKRLLSDHDPIIREHAQWALERIDR